MCIRDSNDDAPAIPPGATERGVKAAVEAIRVLIREDKIGRAHV